MARHERFIGEVLDGKYRLERLLGRGGMGAVYLATHLGTERAVALKLIAPQFMRNEEFVERFKREARAAGRLRHPNVVDVTDFGFASADGERLAYLVMEYLDGCTLADVLAEERRLPLTWVVDILEQVCSAVDEAHQQGIVHRDLKPDNIWLEPNRLGSYRVKVLDFGIAKLGEAGFDEDTETPRPAVDPLPSSSGSAAPPPQSSLESVQASIARAAASLRAHPARESDGGDGAQPPEAATQLYAPTAQLAPVAATTEEQRTQILAPAGDTATDEDRDDLPDAAGLRARGDAQTTAPDNGAARPTVNERAGAQTTALDAGAPRSTHLAEDADRTRMLDAPPDARGRGEAEAATPQSLAHTNAASPSLTRVGSIMGTPLFMSPEQCRGERLDARSDIYSLGVIAYQMLSGETPFAGDMVAVMRQHTEAEPPPLRERNRKVPKRTARVVTAALAKDPAARHPSAASFASALSASTEGTDTLLRRSFALYSEHFPLFLRVSLVSYLPLIVVTLLFFALQVSGAMETMAKPLLYTVVGAATLLMVVFNFLGPMIISGVTVPIVMQMTVAPLKPLSIRPAFALLRLRARPFAVTSLIVISLTFAGMLCFVVPALVMMIRWALVGPVVIMEGLSKRAAMRRSAELVRRSWRTVTLIILIECAAPFVVTALFNSIFGENVTALAAGGGGGTKLSVSNNLSSLLNVFVVPVMAIMTTLLYLQTRRAGGETLRDVTRQFEEHEPPRSVWQQRMRERLSPHTSQGRARQSQTSRHDPKN